MLPQTKRCVAALKDAGLTRAQFRIRTLWKPSTNDYGDPHIDIVCSYTQIAPYVQKLAKSFKVVVTMFDGVPSSVAIHTSHEVGLYRLEHGREEPMKEIVFNSSFKQLPLWDTS
jgi:hypothetical protein